MTTPRVVVAVLAAGQARRFGGGKMWADLGGRPLIRYAMDAALPLGHPTAAIVDARDTDRHAILPDGVAVIPNPAAETGMGSSIIRAIRWAMERRADALLLTLGDMPFVTTALLADLIEAAEGGAMATAQGDGTPGPPLLIPALLYRHFLAIDPAKGAKHLLAGIDDLRVHCCDPELLADIDTADQMTKARARLRTE